MTSRCETVNPGKREIRVYAFAENPSELRNDTDIKAQAAEAEQEINELNLKQKLASTTNDESIKTSVTSEPPLPPLSSESPLKSLNSILHEAFPNVTIKSNPIKLSRPPSPLELNLITKNTYSSSPTSKQYQSIQESSNTTNGPSASPLKSLNSILHEAVPNVKIKSNSIKLSRPPSPLEFNLITKRTKNTYSSSPTSKQYESIQESSNTSLHNHSNQSLENNIVYLNTLNQAEWEHVVNKKSPDANDDKMKRKANGPSELPSSSLLSSASSLKSLNLTLHNAVSISIQELSNTNSHDQSLLCSVDLTFYEVLQDVSSINIDNSITDQHEKTMKPNESIKKIHQVTNHTGEITVDAQFWDDWWRQGSNMKKN
ncbi:hypothetical protein HCN44_003381 [Aphidius gifuensis]|uniref:Uncharacterized protein n=1 Tax=Aphidius gifuensis TaxID=684658 RepID=A0A834Y0I9_APHGI|nr:hypothetical protein HCN44_003381 [Aphidius gifuensis]